MIAHAARGKVLSSAIALTIGLAGCSSHESGTTAPPLAGSISGAVRTATGSTGIAGAAVILRRSSGDSLGNAASDSSGSFRFANVSAGSYRVSVRIPPGHTAAAPGDTAKAISVAAGEAATVQFVATAITQIVDTVRVAKSDTLILANGARIVVTLPAGSPPVPLTVRTAPADNTTWDRTVIGPAVQVEFPASSSAALGTSMNALQTATTGPPFTLSYSLPLTGSVVSPAQPTARGMFVVTGSSVLAAANLTSQQSSVLNPLTGLNQTFLNGGFQLSPQDLQTLHLTIVAANLECSTQFSLKPDDDFTGTEPLVLIHGIQLGSTDCDDVAKYDPAKSTFGDLVAALKSNPAIKAKYHLYTYKYPDYAGVASAAIDFAGRRLPSLTQNGAKVTIIAHSMGGLVARQLLSLTGVLPSISQVITLATPHKGTPLADATQADITSSRVQTCYGALSTIPPSPARLPWSVLNSVRKLWFQNGSPAILDLKTSSGQGTPAEAAAALFSTFQGETTINAVNHVTGRGIKEDGISLVENSVMAQAECFMDVSGNTPNDGFVVKSSALPSWSPRQISSFKRDHIQMAGADASNVNDAFIASLINYLIFPPTNPPPVLVLVSGNNQVAAAGQPLPQPITVEARTSAGSVLPNVIVRFTTAPGGGTVTPQSVSTNSQGRAVINWTLGGSAGIQNLTAAIGGYATATISAYAVTTGGTGCPNFTPYTLGTTVAAALTTSDCTVVTPPDPALYYSKAYAAPVPQSQAIQARLTSTAFRPKASVYIEPSGWSLGLVAPVGSQTAITNALVAPGTFAVRALAATPETTGAYTFSTVAVSNDVTSCTPFLLTSGVTTTQQLTSSDCAGTRTYDRYLVGIPPGWTIVTTMTSTAVDALLQLYQGDDLTFQVQDNNSGGGTNARLSYTSPTNSSYYLHATSASGVQLGQYTLTFTLVPPSAALRSGVRSSNSGVAPGEIAAPSIPPM